MTINGVARIPWAKHFVTRLKRQMNNVSKNNVLAARVEVLQISGVAVDFETATSLTFNRFSAYLQ